MPWLINRHGYAKCVPDDDRGHYAAAIKNGCRPVAEADWNHINSGTANFACPWIDDAVIGDDGFVKHMWPKGVLGDRAVLVRGCGPSQFETVKGAFVLHGNPRKESPDADAMVSIDSIWWTQGRNTGTREKVDTVWVQEWPYHKDKTFFMGPCGSGVADNITRNSFRFGLPIHPIKTADCGDALFVAHEGAIQKINIVGLCAILLAQYISAGPIILTGFDLKGNHIRDEEHDYEGSQLHRFEAAAKALKGVYLHPNNPGPLRDVFPIWEGI